MKQRLYKQITKDQWQQIYRPIPNPIRTEPAGTPFIDNCLFAVEGPQRQYVDSMHETEVGRVWTVVEVDTSKLSSEAGSPLDNRVIVSGLRTVAPVGQPVGYLITEGRNEATNEFIEAYDGATLKALRKWERASVQLLSKEQEAAIKAYFDTYHSEYPASRRKRSHDGPPGKTIIDHTVTIQPGLTICVSTPSPFSKGQPAYLLWRVINQ